MAARDGRRAARPLEAWLILLMGVGSAHAHLPHDRVEALDIADDFGASGRGVLLLRLDGQTNPDRPALLWTTDHGRHWDPLPPPPTTAASAGVALLGEDVVLVGADGALLVFQGAEWRELEAPNSLLVEDADAGPRGLLLATTLGAQVLDTAEGDWEIIDDSSVDRARWDLAGADAVIVRTALGVRAGPSGALVDLPPPPVSPDALALRGETAWIGGVGGVWRWSGAGWEACGDLPVGGGDYAGDVVQLGGDATLLIAGTGQDLYLSTDDCATFTAAQPFATRAVYDESLGQLASPEAAFIRVFAQDDQLIVAGHRGVSVRAGATAPWWEARLLDGRLIRGLGAYEGALYLASYGGGLLTTTDGGATMVGTNAGLLAANLYGRDVATLDGEHLTWLGDINASQSDDGGSSFEATTLPFAWPSSVHALDDRLWAVADSSSDLALAFSDDGVTWTRVGMDAAVGALHAGVWEGGPALFAANTEGEKSWISLDGGVTWTDLINDGAPVYDVLTVGARLIRAGTGIQYSDDKGVTFIDVVGGPTEPRQLLVSDDGLLFAVTLDGALWRSTDDGEVWTPSGGPFSFPQELIAVDGRLLLSTLTGVWWSADGGEAWQQLPTLDRVAASSDDLRCRSATGEPCMSWTDGVAFRQWMVPGDTAAVSSVGGALRVVGRGSGCLSVTVDGAPLGAVGVGEVIDLGGDGWKDVVLGGIEGIVELEAVELGVAGTAFDGGTAPEPAAAPTCRAAPACGCQSAPPRGIWGALLLLFGVRRRPYTARRINRRDHALHH